MFVDNQINSKHDNGHELMHMMLDMVKSLGQDIDALIEEATCMRKTAFTSPDYHGQRTEVCENLIKVDTEEQQLLTELDVLEYKNDERLAQMLKQQLNALGCTLQQNRSKYDGSLYRFDFRNERSITVRLDGTQLRLVKMCPVNANFNNIKQFLDETQDLIGLLVCFGNSCQIS